MYRFVEHTFVQLWHLVLSLCHQMKYLSPGPAMGFFYQVKERRINLRLCITKWNLLTVIIKIFTCLLKKKNSLFICTKISLSLICWESISVYKLFLDNEQIQLLFKLRHLFCWLLTSRSAVRKYLTLFVLLGQLLRCF